MFFVSGNLKTAVGRGVADGTSGLQVLFSQFLNDDGAGSRFVAEDAVEFGVTAYLFDQFLRKRRAVGFEMSSALQIWQACHFPVSGDGIFIAADFFHMAVSCRQV